jgi:NADP-dependent 3-hydroxy acid dehydrogenase YdfG
MSKQEEAMRFANKVVLVTGATSGIGRAAASHERHVQRTRV